jgi:membrane protease YdiL (CAAX protease family)
MGLKGQLKDESPLAKLFWLLFISLGFFFVSGVLGLLLVGPIFGIDLLNDPEAFQQLGDPQVIRALKFAQVVNAIGFFVIPAFLFAWLTGTNLSSFFGLQRRMAAFPVMVVLLLVVAALPLENFIGWLNESIHFPDFLMGLEQSFRAMQAETEQTVMAFLKMEGPSDLIMNLIIIALIPAIGEEMLFRGWMQPLLIQRNRSIHAGIWITAALFSLVHMQFFAFFPRLIMGAALGYIYFWSRSLWYPMIAHFANNALAVLAIYFMDLGKLPDGVDDAGRDNLALFAISLAASILLLFATRRYFNQEGH